jgi:hypothetical protein
MSKGKAVTLAVFTAWPFLYFILFFCMVFGMSFSDLSGGDSSGLPLAFKIIFPLHLLTMLEMIILLVIYIVYLFKSDRVAQDKKVLWAVVLFLGNIIAMPIFWYLYIWKEPNNRNQNVGMTRPS